MKHLHEYQATRARKAAEAALKVLLGRKGFDDWWYDILPGDQDDIRVELIRAIKEAL